MVALLVVSVLVSAPAEPFRFEIVQKIDLPAAPANSQQAKLWIPVPIDGDGQSVVRLDVPPGAKLTREPTSGNRFLYFDYSKASDLPKSLEVKYAVRRTAVAVEETHQVPYRLSDELLSRWSQPEPQSAAKTDLTALAAKLVPASADTYAKGRAFYSHVFDHMTYDKQEPGWGKANVQRACDVGKGNCTDFHGLFIALCQTAKIPARLEMGLTLPIKNSPSYHCWASFYAGKQGWVPVDISDTRKTVKEPKSASDEQRFAGFGKLTAERIVMGRGIETPLAPPGSKPVRFVLNPVLEVDGTRVADGEVKSRWTSAPVKE